MLTALVAAGGAIAWQGIDGLTGAESSANEKVAASGADTSKTPERAATSKSGELPALLRPPLPRAATSCCKRPATSCPRTNC